MKFNYIIGNPPYQSPTSGAGKGSNKLYFKITDRLIKKFSTQMYFICPKAIIVESTMNPSFDIIKKFTSKVSDVGEYFKEATVPVSFLVNSVVPKSLTYNGEIIEQIEYCYSSKEFWDFYQKISIRYNKRKKLKIKPSHSPVGYKASEIIETKTDYPLLHQSNGEEDSPGKRKIKYIDTPIEGKESLKPRLIIAYGGGWFDPIITDMYLAEFFGVVDDTYDLENVKSYLSTNTIKRFILEYNKVIGASYYNALWQLPELDFSHPWDDEMLKKEFNILP